MQASNWQLWLSAGRRRTPQDKIQHKWLTRIRLAQYSRNEIMAQPCKLLHRSSTLSGHFSSSLQPTETAGNEIVLSSRLYVTSRCPSVVTQMGIICVTQITQTNVCACSNLRGMHNVYSYIGKNYGSIWHGLYTFEVWITVTRPDVIGSMGGSVCCELG